MTPPAGTTAQSGARSSNERVLAAGSFDRSDSVRHFAFTGHARGSYGAIEGAACVGAVNDDPVVEAIGVAVASRTDSNIAEMAEDAS